MMITRQNKRHKTRQCPSLSGCWSPTLRYRKGQREKKHCKNSPWFDDNQYMTSPPKLMNAWIMLLSPLNQLFDFWLLVSYLRITNEAHLSHDCNYAVMTMKIEEFCVLLTIINYGDFSARMILVPKRIVA